MVLQEMTGPIGIPDFTALIGDGIALRNRMATDIPPLLHQVDAAVASVAHPRVPRVQPLPRVAVALYFALVVYLVIPFRQVARRLSRSHRSGK